MKKKIIILDLDGVKDLTTGEFLDGYELIIPEKLWRNFLHPKFREKEREKRGKQKKRNIEIEQSVVEL